MATIASIRTAIKTILSTITEIAYVYDYHNPDLEGYPAVTFDMSDQEGDFLTNVQNEEAISYIFMVYQEVKEKTQAQAKDILDTVADKIKIAFANNYSLSGVIDVCRPVIGERVEIQTTQGLVYGQKITLKCRFSTLIV